MGLQVFDVAMDDLEDNGWTLIRGKTIAGTAFIKATSLSSPLLIMFRDEETPYPIVSVRDRKTLIYSEAAIDPTIGPHDISEVINLLLSMTTSLVSAFREMRAVYPGVFFDYLGDPIYPGDPIAHFMIGGLPSNLMVIVGDTGMLSITTDGESNIHADLDELPAAVFRALEEHEQLLDEARWDQSAATAATMELLLQYVRVVTEDMVDNGWAVAEPVIDGAICRITARRNDVSVMFETETGNSSLYVCVWLGSGYERRVGWFHLGDPHEVGVGVEKLVSLASRVKVAFDALDRDHAIETEIQPLWDFSVDDDVALALLLRILPVPGRRSSSFELIVYNDGTYNAELPDDALTILTGTLESMPIDIRRYFTARTPLREGYFTSLASRISSAVLG